MIPSACHSDISKEEEEERRIYGGFSSRVQKEKFVGSFPGNYAWACRLDNLGSIVQDFHPEEMKYLSFYESSNLTSNGLGDDTGVLLKPLRTWYEVPQSTATSVGKASSMLSTQFVTGIKKSARERLQNEDPKETNVFKHHYENHCFLPAASHEKSKLLRVDFVPNFVVAYYGQHNAEHTSHQRSAVGMAVYSVDSRSYSYIR